MAFEHWGYTFEGAFPTPDRLENRPGIFVVWCRAADEKNWTVIDVGESQDVKARILSHESAEQWKKLCTGTMFYAATYPPNISSAGRAEIEKKLIEQAKPLCRKTAQS